MKKRDFNAYVMPCAVVVMIAAAVMARDIVDGLTLLTVILAPATCIFAEHRYSKEMQRRRMGIKKPLRTSSGLKNGVQNPKHLNYNSYKKKCKYT